MAKILVVEDDRALSQVLCDELSLEHHILDSALTGTDADEKLRFYEYDMVVLDWDLPGIPGIEVLKKLRQRGKLTPVLMLTGKDKLQDKETGLDSGADDYLTKPFEMREFSARVRAIIRRVSSQSSNVLQSGSLVLDQKKFTVTRNGEIIQLRPKEFALLEFFLRHKNEVFSGETLLTRVWPSDSESTSETVRSYIKTLRAKIDEPGKPSRITNVFAVGYKFEE